MNNTKKKAKRQTNKKLKVKPSGNEKDRILDITVTAAILLVLGVICYNLAKSYDIDLGFGNPKFQIGDCIRGMTDRYIVGVSDQEYHYQYIHESHSYIRDTDNKLLVELSIGTIVFSSSIKSIENRHKRIPCTRLSENE